MIPEFSTRVFTCGAAAAALAAAGLRELEWQVPVFDEGARVYSAVDAVGRTDGGEWVVVELKTGPVRQTAVGAPPVVGLAGAPSDSQTTRDMAQAQFYRWLLVRHYELPSEARALVLRVDGDGAHVRWGTADEDTWGAAILDTFVSSAVPRRRTRHFRREMPPPVVDGA